MLFLLCCFFTGCVKEETDNRDTGFIVAVGDPAPDFQIHYQDGNTQSLISLRGKVVLIQFAASWCKVCQDIMPLMEREFNLRYKSHPDFTLFAVCRGQTPEEVQQFAEKVKVTYPLTLDEDESIFRLYALAKAGVTRNVLIDKDGKIVYLTRLYNEQEFAQLNKTIDSLLQP
ncbi:MAG: TlpA disulfide reductase family protein [Petrimonas sp.]|nr:TlpA disulfide reductase family protein [Petrimonas sp.]